MMLNVHRNHEAFQGRGEEGMEVGGEGDNVPFATVTPAERLLHSGGQR